MRAWLGLVLVAGCDYVLHLDEVKPIEDARGGDGTGRDGGGGDGSAGPAVTYIAPGDIDGDGKDNTVDPCPLLMNENPQDSDGDGLPDACDPDLNTATGGKDCIVLLDGFYGHTLDPRWTFDTPWAVASTQTNGAGLYSPSAAHAMAYFDAHVDAARVEADVRIAGAVGGILNTIFVAGDMKVLAGADATGRGCALAKTGASSGQAEVVDMPAPTVYARSTQLTTHAYAQGSEFYPQWTMGPLVDRCAMAETESGVEATYMPPTASDRVGVRVNQTSVVVFYIVAYGRSCK